MLNRVSGDSWWQMRSCSDNSDIELICSPEGPENKNSFSRNHSSLTGRSSWSALSTSTPSISLFLFFLELHRNQIFILHYPHHLAKPVNLKGVGAVSIGFIVFSKVKLS